MTASLNTGGSSAAVFTFWSDAKRLLSADCPACERRVTVATFTWRRWLRSVSTSPETRQRI